MPIDIVVTGANGAIGTALIKWLGGGSSIIPSRLRALVRSMARAESLRPLPAEIIELNYENSESVRAAIEGANAVVHLSGSLLPSTGDSLEQANIQTTRAVVEAAMATGVKYFVYLSFPGADPSSKNAYLRSKGLAEEIIREGVFSGAIFRTPMIIGPKNASLEKLQKLASSAFIPLVGGGSVRLQPIYQGDVLAAISWALSQPSEPLRVIDLVGPETITYVNLLRRVALRLGRKPTVLPVPRLLGWLTFALMGVLAPKAGLNRSVYEILFHEHLADHSATKGLFPFTFSGVNDSLALSLPAQG